MDNNILTLPLLVALQKIVCFVIGYLIVRMGYKLIVDGIKGDFKFTSQYKGLKGGLISSSPGLLFVLLGILLIGYTMFVNKPFTYHGSNGKVDVSQKHMLDTINQVDVSGGQNTPLAPEK